MPWHFSALLLTINTLGYDCDEPPRGEITKAESSRREIRRRVFRVFALFIADAALVFFFFVRFGVKQTDLRQMDAGRSSSAS